MASHEKTLHYDVIKWKRFPRYWAFVRGIHRSPVNSPHKGQWRGPLMFSLICAWTNGWVNNRDAGDLWPLRAHYDVTVMTNHLLCWGTTSKVNSPHSGSVMRVNIRHWCYDQMNLCSPQKSMLKRLRFPCYPSAVSITVMLWRLKSPATRMFVQQFFFTITSKEISKVRITGPMGGESTDDRRIPLTKWPVMRKACPCYDVVMLQFIANPSTIPKLTYCRLVHVFRIKMQILAK